MTEEEPAPSAKMTDPEAPGDAPPAYHNDKPPSYDSLFGKVKQAKCESSGTGDYLCRVFVLVFCGTCCTAIHLVFQFALPIAMVVMGARYKDNCPAERYIPIYLIVGGSFGILVGICSTIAKLIKCRKGEEDDDPKKQRPDPISSFVNCFLFAWFIAGNYWVYHIHKTYQSADSAQPMYCDQTLYLFAFWLITTTYIFLGLCLVCCCGLGLLAMCIGN